VDESISLPLINEGLDTPKKIYRCHKDKKSIKKYQNVFDKTKKLMPDYEQIIYTDEMIEKFIKKNFSERIYNAYKHINPKYGAARSDFFRMLVIYHHGGVYMDIKSGPKNNKINNVIENNQGKLLVTRGEKIPYGIIPYRHFSPLTRTSSHDWSFVTNTNYNEYLQWYIISNRGNPIIGEMIKQMVSNIEHGIKHPDIYANGSYSVLALTGPICYSRVIDRNFKSENKKKFKIINNNIMNHHLIDYKKIENNHYSLQEDLRVIIS
jgi:mannosyltransferase OCH1-like enzyme